MRNIFLLCITLGLVVPGYSGNVIIKYIVDTRAGFHPQRILWLTGAGNRNDMFIRNFMDSSIAVPMRRVPIYMDSVTEVFSITYETDQTKCYFLTDGMGREILLDPGNRDTITVHIGQVNLIGKAPHLNDSIMSPWMSAAYADTRHAYVYFFDSLARSYGDINVRLFYSYRKSGNDLGNYLSYIQSVYKARLEYLRQFAARHYFPQRLRYLANKEIQYSFYDDLLDPVVYFNNETEYPQILIDSIDAIGKDLDDEDLFENTSLYKKVLRDYLFNVRIKRSKEYRDSTHLASCFTACENDLKGRIRDYMLAGLMSEYIKYDPRQNVVNIYPLYHRGSGRSRYQPYIDSLYRQYILATPLRAGEVSALLFENDRMQQIHFKDITQKEWIIVDCWATWCLPCKQEQPYLEKLAREYRDRVQFVALSADRDVLRWRRYIATRQVDTSSSIVQLYAPGAFENLFFQKLHIQAIPRYVLVSSAGEILEPALPRPSSEADVKKILDHYLNK